jgi:hypothetical protein
VEAGEFRIGGERIEPIAELFSDLDGSIDAREDDYEQKAADPKLVELSPNRAFSRRWKPVNFGSAAFCS